MDKNTVAVLRTFPKREYCKGDFIIRQGEKAACVYYLTSGTCVRNIYSPRGDEITYGERRADGSASCLLGALTFYTDNQVHRTNFIAKTKCVCHVIRENQFREFLDEHPDVLHDLVGLALRSYNELNENFQAKLKGLAPSRIASYLLEHSSKVSDGVVFNGHLNMSGMGRELGMHRITVGKIIRAFGEEGLISYRGKTLYIIDPVALKVFADGLSTIDYQQS